MLNGFFDLFPMLAARLRSEDGQSMVEYGILIALIALVVIAVVTGLGKQVVQLFSSASTSV